MGFFKRGGDKGAPKGGKRFGAKPFEKRSYGGGGGYGSRDSGKPMFKATCAECGEIAEVPFRPTGGKPVLCKRCFRPEERAPRERFERGGYGKSKFPPKRQFEGGARGSDQVEKRLGEMNAKLDLIIREIEALKDR